MWVVSRAHNFVNLLWAHPQNHAVLVAEHCANYGLPYKEGVGGSSPSTPTCCDFDNAIFGDVGEKFTNVGKGIASSVGPS